MDNTLFGVSEWFVICHHEMADFLVVIDIKNMATIHNGDNWGKHIFIVKILSHQLAIFREI